FRRVLFRPIPAKLSKVLNCGSMINMGTVSNKLMACTRKLPNRSVSQPPSQEPHTEPKPKQPNTIPTCALLKCSSEAMYMLKNGMTIEPVRLISITSAKSQASVDKPRYESI